jgi:hypothetical protein
MNTKARIVLTAGLGLLMGLSTWMTDGSSADGVMDRLAFGAAILVPLIIGRWWVVAALAGPFIASVALDLTGYVPERVSDGPEFEGLSWVIFFLVVYGLFMLILVGIRKAFDHWRRRQAAATNGGHALASNSSDS